VGDHLQYGAPPEEVLYLALRLFLGKFHVIAKITAFLCVTPSGVVDDDDDYYYLLQLSCHSVAVVLTPVQIKQIRINIHKRNNTKHSKCKYTY
jgi:hypothetical protein